MLEKLTASLLLCRLVSGLCCSPACVSRLGDTSACKMAHNAAFDIASTVVKSSVEAVVLVFKLCQTVVTKPSWGTSVVTVAFLTDPEQWCVDLVDCLVVLIRRGLCSACGVNCRALLSPARQLAILGRTVGPVWGTARDLRPTWQYPR